jgi:hypothetical protein
VTSGSTTVTGMSGYCGKLAVVTTDVPQPLPYVNYCHQAHAVTKVDVFGAELDGSSSV